MKMINVMLNSQKNLLKKGFKNKIFIEKIDLYGKIFL